MRRQFYRKSDPLCIKDLKDFFATAYRDKNNQSYFYKYEFYEGLKKFFNM